MGQVGAVIVTNDCVVVNQVTESVTAVGTVKNDVTSSPLALLIDIVL